MGATSWRYYAPYRTDAEEALQRLRAEVFARREYVDLTGSMEDQLRQTFTRFGQDPDSPAVRVQINEGLRFQRALETGDLRGLSGEMRSAARRALWFGRLARLLGAAPSPTRRRPPRSIEELLEAAEECGTHSILDIEHVESRPAFGVAAPVSAKALKELFGSAEPTHAQVEERWADIAEDLDHGECRYLVVYLDGQPHEYAFIGCSGD